MGPDDIGSTRAPRKRGRPRHFKPTQRRPPSSPSGPSRGPSPSVHQEPLEPSEPLTEPVEDYREPEEVRDRNDDESPETSLRPPRRPAERQDYEEPRPRQERRPRAERREAPPRERKPATAEAIRHVEQIIVDLKHALEDMELVLELIEEAERQQIDDDREIGALKKSLERVNRFRRPSE